MDHLPFVPLEDNDVVQRKESNKMTILEAWNQRRKLCAEGDKLCAEGNKFWAKGDKLYAESNKLWAEGRKLRAEGDILFYDAIIATHGKDTVITWDGSDATVKGVRYKFKELLKGQCDGEIVEIKGTKYRLSTVE